MKFSPYDPVAWIDQELTELSRHHLLRSLAMHAGPQQALLRDEQGALVNFGSNDYLGLAADPRLAAAAREALNREGCGAGASPLVTGRSAALAALEVRLAAFEAAEAAVVFSSGYAANLGAITALAGRGDAIYADQRNHASMIDACRLSRAETLVYPHGDWHTLAARLGESAGRFRRRLIVTESLFSMDGDRAPLVELADLAERHECMLLVDEAHATGVFGQHGRGLAEELGVEHRVAVRVGTLSKALGCAGGFVCGTSSLAQWLINRARPYVFSTALPPPMCAAAMAAIEIVERQPRLRAELAERSVAVRDALRRQGWNLGKSDSHIIPLVVGSAAGALALSARLRELGLLVPAIRPPSVPPEQSLLRISLGAGHTDDMIAGLIAALGTLSASPSTPGQD